MPKRKPKGAARHLEIGMSEVGTLKLQPHHSNESIAGLSVFIVEDDGIIAVHLEDLLIEAECEVVGPALRLEAATKLVEEDIAVGAAVLDVNLGTSTVFPVAERLREIGIAIVFATGYGREGVPDEWMDCPILQKPYTIRQVEDAILTVLATAAT